jgi:pimeloyl-ACP methyl ester carboxylesterase
MKSATVALWVALLTTAVPALAQPHELRLPLDNGKLRWADLSAVLCNDLHLPAWRVGKGEINLNGWRGSLFLQGLNASLGDGCRVMVSDGALVFDFDPAKLPSTGKEAKTALRNFVATETPQATAAQNRRYGLFLPAHVDASRNLVVLIHGLDCGASMLYPMGELLAESGSQIAYFSYPCDQDLGESAKLLEKHLAAVRETFPGIRFDFVCHSMGGLIARDYVESDQYANDVDHLILVGTPNSGSRWVKYYPILKAQHEVAEWRSDPEWRWSWIITEGLGEAADDVTPRSAFLRALNARPRRAGVKYTIIAGSHSSVATFEADLMDAVAAWIPAPADAIRDHLQAQADDLRHETGNSDGPVSVRSAKLPGVSDVVILPADHRSLFVFRDGQPPAAFTTIHDRLFSH